MALSTRHLRAFLAVAESGSITKSSGIIRRAQSAITRSIHELEREIGGELFERRAHGMLLTEFGRALLERFRAALAELEAVREVLKRDFRLQTSAYNAPIFTLGDLSP